MSPSQSQAGRAFEYAIVLALQTVLGEDNVEVEANSCVTLGATDFASFTTDVQQEMRLSAIAALQHLVEFEPNLQAEVARIGKLQITMQPDQMGGFGDVRDVLITNQTTGWQIGISAKHRHEALKHSRLSSRIDFGQQWFGHPCSEEYFETIHPVFAKLTEQRAQGLAWSDLGDKEGDVYAPLLAAFRAELLKLDSLHPGIVAPRMVQYLIGTQDFYKIIKLNDQVKVQVYSFNGTLNQKAGAVKAAARLDQLKLPTRIIEFDLRRESDGTPSATTLELVCDGGWQLSFRLHNASTRVEPSLKFDINLVGRPNSLQTFSIIPSRD